VLFSAWLTYLELFVIDAICRWCVFSAVLALVLFGLSLWDWQSLRDADQPTSRPADKPIMRA